MFPGRTKGAWVSLGGKDQLIDYNVVNVDAVFRQSLH